MTSDRSTKNKITISDNGNRPLTFKISEVEVAGVCCSKKIAKTVDKCSCETFPNLSVSCSHPSKEAGTDAGVVSFIVSNDTHQV